MAKCEKCGFPYATGNHCPNCKSKSPQGTFWGKFTSFLLVVGLIWAGITFFSNSGSSYSEDLPHESIQQENSNVQQQNLSSELTQNSDESKSLLDEDGLINGHRNYQEVMYECRECKIPLEWKGSYYWTEYPNGNHSTEWDIDVVPESKQYEDRFIEDQYFYEGSYTTGLFCSAGCAMENHNRFKYPKQDIERYNEMYGNQ